MQRVADGGGREGVPAARWASVRSRTTSRSPARPHSRRARRSPRSPSSARAPGWRSAVTLRRETHRVALMPAESNTEENPVDAGISSVLDGLCPTTGNRGVPVRVQARTCRWSHLKIWVAATKTPNGRISMASRDRTSTSTSWPIATGRCSRVADRPTHEEYREARRLGKRISFWLQRDASNRQGNAVDFAQEVQTFHTTGQFAMGMTSAMGMTWRSGC